MHTTLITGINGFVGQHLAREMNQAGCTVLGVGQAKTIAPAIDQVSEAYYRCDLTKPDEVARLPLETVDSIINLAGLATVGASFDNPELYYSVNVGTFTNLADRLLTLNRKILVLAISTGAVYDDNQQPPFNEESPLAPLEHRSPYSESKIRMEKAVKEYRAKGLNALIVRPFNHVGPGQLPGFLVPNLAEQITQVLERGDSSITVGNLDNQRDFTDVRDVARAYRLLATAASGVLRHDLYNVCTGRALSGKTIFNLLLKEYEATHLEVTIDKGQPNPRKIDPPVLYGDSRALSLDTGWQPTIPIEQTIADFVAWQKTQA